MGNIKYYLITLLLIIVNMSVVYADCTDDELNELKLQIDKIEITYKHLGEVTKEDGSKVYNEFMVTANNMPNDVYVHLFPTVDEEFVEGENTLSIKLTSGDWIYYLYSGKCEDIVDQINVKIPKFNMYSLDPLCEGIDGEDFKPCGKYYESELSRESFDRRVKQYIYENSSKKTEDKQEKDSNILNVIINYLKDNYLYIVIPIFVLIMISILFIVYKRSQRRKVL